MKCPSCGFENEEGSKYCQSCGANLAEAAAEGTGQSPGQETPPPPPPPSAEPPPGQAPPPTSSQPPPGGAPPPPPKASPTPGGQIDLGGWISKGFNEVFSDFGNYLVMAIIVGIGGGITFGILAGPLYAGALMVTRKKIRGEGPIDIGEIFSIGFGKFVPTFLLVFIPMLIIGIIAMIPVIGWIVTILAMGWLLPWWAIAIYYVMDENAEFMDAGSRAWRVITTNLGMFWVLGFVTSIVSGIGIILCGIGVFITLPVGIVMMALLVESYFPKR